MVKKNKNKNSNGKWGVKGRSKIAAASDGTELAPSDEQTQIYASMGSI